jgi:hypothetical protein
MTVESDLLGVLRHHRWIEAGDQRKRLEAYGCRKMLDLSKGNELGAGQPELLRLAGPGRTFVLVHAFLLADPKAMKKRGGLKASFDAALKAVEARGSIVRDLETGLTTETKPHRKAIVAVSHNHISRASRGERSALNGKLSQGRPPRWANPADRKIIWEEWHSALNRTNDEAAAAASKRMDKEISPNSMWKVVKAMRVEKGHDAKGASGRRPNKIKAMIAATYGKKQAEVGSIYFVRNGRRRRIKIGYTGDYRARISNLMTASGDELKLVALIRGSRQDEKALHYRFGDYWVKGEWFKFEGELAEYVRSLPKPPRG